MSFANSQDMDQNNIFFAVFLIYIDSFSNKQTDKRKYQPYA